MLSKHVAQMTNARTCRHRRREAGDAPRPDVPPVYLDAVFATAVFVTALP